MARTSVRRGGTSTFAPDERSGGKSAVIAALLFGGGFFTGSVVNSVPGLSDGRFGDPRVGPGDGRMGDGTLPRPGDEDLDRGTDDDGSTESSFFGG